MSKIPKQSIPTGVKFPTAPVTQKEMKSSISTVTRWLPFICAGAAVGVSILALKELKKVKSEMTVVKTQQNNTNKTDPELNKKMDQFDVQLKKVNEFLMNNNSKNPKIIKSVVKSPEIPKDVKIINEVQENKEVPESEEYEYEEVEVTDDEEEN